MNSNYKKIKIGSIFKDSKRDIEIIDIQYKKNNRGQKYKYCKYICNKCGWKDGWARESSIRNGVGCACCNGTTLVKGINDIPTTNPEVIKFFQGKKEEAQLYTKGSHKKIYPICPDCGRIKDKKMEVNKICIYKSIGCICNDKVSFGQKYIFKLLCQLSVNFKQEVSFNWCVFKDFKNKGKKHKGIYDFVIEDKNIIIEVDGAFHRNDNKMSGQTKEESKYIDYEKDKLANKNGYKVIRISDENNFKNNILNSELSLFFNLNNIDWMECEIFGTKNLTKEVCNYWNNKKENETTHDLEKIFMLSRSAIINYLKKGSKLGWCNYNSKEEMKKSALKNGTSNCKRVEIFKDNLSLGIFESCHELERISEQRFKNKLGFSMISAVCRGDRKQYKGFTFRYI